MARHERDSDDGSIKISKTMVWQVISFVLLVVLVVSIFTAGFGYKAPTTGNGGTGNNPNNPPSGGNGGTTDVKVSLDGANIMGDKSAKVAIIEYSDFQCPFCSRFASDAGVQIVNSYVKTGKAYLVYKQFPLEQLHPMALSAALASECAAEQGKFWDYHDKLFTNQASLSVDNMKQWAKDLGLDATKFNTCLDSQKYLSKVRADTQEGISNGIQGTPGFLINGQLVSGAQPFSVFQQVIDSALK